MELITYSDYPRLKKFFHYQKYNHCVYSLSSIIVWKDHVYQPYGVIKDDALIVCAEFNDAYKENRHLILPVSPVREFSPEELYETAVNLGFKTYWFVPESYMEKFGQNQITSFFDIESQPEFDDYVYLTDDLANLKGNKYSKKRNLINQFKKAYVRKGRVKVEEITPADVTACADFLDEWCKERSCEQDQDVNLECEKRAAINALENMDILEMRGLLLRIDGKISAFGIASHLTEDMGVLHFEKAFASIKGLYQFFDNQCAKLLFKGYKYINKESDMNIPGLAKAKKSYHPVMMITSYKLTIRQ